MQADPAFAGSNAATQTMLNKFKAVAKKGTDIDVQVRSTQWGFSLRRLSACGLPSCCLSCAVGAAISDA